MIKLKKILTSKYLLPALFILNCFVFLLLLFKNPYSERNLIPNLEPYPDAIHYLTPALSFVKGNGFYIEREGRLFKPTVPFLYSLTLAPIFLISDDVRTFYITNILLAFTGLIFFWIFLNRITSNKFIPPFITFLYITNYFVYWYPNLAMAENLSLTLFMVALFLLSSKVTPKLTVIAGLICVGLYASKYANFTLSAVFAFSYLLKIFFDNTERWALTRIYLLKKSKPALTFILSSTLSLIIFFVIEYLIRGDSIFLKIQYLMEPLIAPPENAVELTLTNPWFSYSYFNKNFPIYFNALTGNPMRFLWDFTPLLPKYLALFSLAGLIVGLFSKNFRLISLYLILFILFPILFLSTFYAADARYIYHVIPSLLSGLAILLSVLFSRLSYKHSSKLFYIFLASLFLFYSFTNFYRLKYQIALNLRHSETPWNYLSVKNFNYFFTDLNSNIETPILITAMPPYYVDYFSDFKYKLLPLSTEQEFSNSKEIVWGDEDYSNFTNIYKKYINQGRDVFVTNASLGNTPYLHRDFNLIKENFKVIKVNEGCLDTCNIYQLKLKP